MTEARTMSHSRLEPRNLPRTRVSGKGREDDGGVTAFGCDSGVAEDEKEDAESFDPVDEEELPGPAASRNGSPSRSL